MSHFINCGSEVEVTGVKNLGRLDGVIITREGMEDLERAITLKITQVKEEQSPQNRCMKVGTEVQLHVKKESQGQFKTGDKLVLQYQNVGDSMGSRISWGIVK